MRTSDDRAVRWVLTNATRRAARGRAAPKTFWTGPAAGSSGRSGAKAALLAAPLACGLALAGCASGIDRAEDACAESRTSMAAFAGCLRRSHAALASGPPYERALFREYLAAADRQVERVRAKEATDAEAMLDLARHGTELAAKTQKEQVAAFKEMLDALQPPGQQPQDQGRQTRDNLVDQPAQPIPYGLLRPPPGPFGLGPPPFGPFGPGHPAFQPAWR